MSRGEIELPTQPASVRPASNDHFPPTVEFDGVPICIWQDPSLNVRFGRIARSSASLLGGPSSTRVHIDVEERHDGTAQNGGWLALCPLSSGDRLPRRRGASESRCVGSSRERRSLSRSSVPECSLPWPAARTSRMKATKALPIALTGGLPIYAGAAASLACRTHRCGHA